MSTTDTKRNRVVARLLCAGSLDIDEAALLLGMADTQLAVPLQPSLHLQLSPPASPPSPPSRNPERQTTTWDLVVRLFYGDTSAEHIKSYLDTIMLLTTLMFGFGAGFLTSFSTVRRQLSIPRVLCPVCYPMRHPS